MSTTELACVGESFEDLIFAGLERLPRLGEELRTKSFLRTYGGGATITAVAAARLGFSTRIISALADGAVARLRAEGALVTNLRKRDELHAITAALSTPNDRAFATFDGVNAELGPRFVTALGRVQAKIVHCALCPRDIKPLALALRAVRARGVLVSFDFGYDLDLAKDPLLKSLIAEADFLLVNEDEAKLYAKRRSLAQAESFWKEHARNTVIKLGASGSRWISRRGTIEEAAPKVNPVDTTGAGDAFNAGFLAGLLSRLPARRALRLGNIVGALSTRAVGGLEGLPRIDEV
ncbi:MAG: carbohydrate kinase family protein [Vicinamibacteria bacterium]